MTDACVVCKRKELEAEIERLTAKLKRVEDEQCASCRAKDDFALKATTP